MCCFVLHSSQSHRDLTISFFRQRTCSNCNELLIDWAYGTTPALNINETQSASIAVNIATYFLGCSYSSSIILFVAAPHLRWIACSSKPEHLGVANVPLSPLQYVWFEMQIEVISWMQFLYLNVSKAWRVKIKTEGLFRLLSGTCVIGLIVFPNADKPASTSNSHQT
jgi:hypothetical protein